MNTRNTLRPIYDRAADILRDDTAPAARARVMAEQLHGKIEAGNLRYLPQAEIFELRALTLALFVLADQLEAARPVPDRARRWWRAWV